MEYPTPYIKEFFGEKPKNALFIPYAAVTFSFEEYEEKVNNRFKEIGHHVTSIHRFINPVEAIENADAIVVGGGNTWQLVRMLHEKGLMKPIRKKVKEGTPYIGWSADQHRLPNAKTTNDMPIVDPIKFKPSSWCRSKLTLITWTTIRQTTGERHVRCASMNSER